MNQLLIGDCHFGASSNSVVWLENQLKFFNTQVVSVLKEKTIDRVIFLGDLFDIRYSVNQQVGIEVKEMIKSLLQQFTKIEFVFVAGNHDFYSPLEEFHKYNAYDMVFGEEFENAYLNVRFVVNEPWYDSHDNLFLPWYYTENFTNFTEIMTRYPHAKNIFCHTDLEKWDVANKTLVGTAQVYSGHIHYPWDKNNLHNLGAMFAFNFSDVNSTRYMYILENTHIIEKIANTTTPQFKRFRNDEIFDLTEEDFKNSYVQLYVFASNINKAKYIERIKEIKTQFADYNVRVQVIDDSMGETLELSYFNANIDTYIHENIPEYLSSKYEIIKEKLKSKPV